MEKSNKGTYIIISIVVIALAVLIIWPRVSDPNKDAKQAWKDAGIDCLVSGHTNIAQHVHPVLGIVVDGEQETIPANVGIVQNCMSETHTHDDTGTLHAESLRADKELTLGQFFAVWGKTIQREGYTLKATLNNEVIANPKDIRLQDHQLIVLEYQSEGFEPTTSSTPFLQPESSSTEELLLEDEPQEASPASALEVTE
jgi:hypothetical protein